MTFSSIPFIFLVEIILLLVATRHAIRRGSLTPKGMSVALMITLLLAGWGVASAYFSISGVYGSVEFLSAWPALWITAPPVIMINLPYLTARGRAGVRAWLDATPAHWLTGIQALRILAIGSIFKALNGDFTYYFPLIIGIPDLLFGLSALWVTARVRQNRIRPGALAAWHLAGAAIILPGAVVLMQLGLPGPVQVYTADPTIAAIFDFPMVLAPTLVVPLLVAVNINAAMRILERRGHAAAVRPAA